MAIRQLENAVVAAIPHQLAGNEKQLERRIRGLERAGERHLAGTMTYLKAATALVSTVVYAGQCPL